MASQFRVMIKCPTTGNLVWTGAVISGPTFHAHDPEYGGFNCSACAQVHSWTREQAIVHEVFV